MCGGTTNVPHDVRSYTGNNGATQGATKALKKNVEVTAGRQPVDSAQKKDRQLYLEHHT